MRNFCILVLMSAILIAGLLSAAGQPANAQETLDRTQVAVILNGVVNPPLRAGPAPQFVTHELCGIGLGGYCPGRYRSCIRAGRPRAECDAWLERCDACNQAMLKCRQKVGHQPGYNCPKCRKALDICRARLSVPTK